MNSSINLHKYDQINKVVSAKSENLNQLTVQKVLL